MQQVFTAGAMGAGKSYTMRKLVQNGRFPLIAFVVVDPDDIRRHLPEFQLYVDEFPELAGELTRKESGFIAEILTLAGLQAGKNVLVDGSLRDFEWYKSYFQRLREEFSGLRLAIIHVTAPRDAIFQRASVRIKDLKVQNVTWHKPP
jgi:predicted kinase